MKIICIEGNYNDNKTNSQFPLFSVKPETCILRNSHPFFLPDHAEHISPRVHIVLKISRLGKNIQEKFAHLYYEEIGIGMDMTPINVLKTCRKEGHPWDTAKCYDYSSPLGNFSTISSFSDQKKIPFSLRINDREVLLANSSDMICSFGKIIEHVSKYITLKMGDMIYTGSPKVDFTVNIDDHIEASIKEKKMLWFNVK